MALTNDPVLAERMRRYRSHGISTDRQLMSPRAENEIWNYQQIDLGFNYRITDIQAALGLSQLKRLDELVAKRHLIAQVYDDALEALNLVIPWQHTDSWSSYHLYPIRVRQSLCGKTQRQIYDALIHAGIGANLHYIPVYRHPYFERLGFLPGHCPEAEAYHKETISLPMYPMLSSIDQEKVIAVLRESLI
jgi:dTDP-4-amino-4,6-dideoxygalactose transaminase